MEQFIIFGLTFKSKRDFTTLLGYKAQLSDKIIQLKYGGSWENVARVRFKGRSDEYIKEQLAILSRISLNRKKYEAATQNILNLLWEVSDADLKKNLIRNTAQKLGIRVDDLEVAIRLNLNNGTKK